MCSECILSVLNTKFYKNKIIFQTCPECSQWISMRIFHWFLMPNFIQSLSTSIGGPKFGSRSSTPNSIIKINVFSLLWIPNFMKIRLYLKRGPKSVEIWNFGTSFEFQITYINKYIQLILSIKIYKHCAHFKFGTKLSKMSFFGSR